MLHEKTLLEGRGVVVDTEYNNIKSWKADKIWCATTYDLDTGEKRLYAPDKEGDYYHEHWTRSKEEFKEYIESFDFVVAHNLWGAENVIFRNILGFEIPLDKGVDTTVWSRLLRPVSPPSEKFGLFKKNGWDNRAGGHSLEAWGRRLGFKKIEFDDFSQYTHDMGTYCTQDTFVNVKIYECVLKEKLEFKFPDLPFHIESAAHYYLQDQVINGFTLDRERAQALVKETDKLIEEYTKKLHEVFPPKKKFVEEYKPRFNKDGAMSAASKKKLLNWIHEEVSPDVYHLYVIEEFNPSSPKQVGERLIDIGWIPRKKTPTGAPSTSKDVIGEAIDQLSGKYPQVEVLRKFNIVTDRNQKAKKWLELSEEDGRMHGSVFHIGPWTHRMSHFNDNMANIAKVKLDDSGTPIEGLEGNFGWESRSCWIPREGWSLVGCDASGIQLRALAHYMNSAAYIKEVTEGDVHVANQKAAGIKDRPTSKTFIYAWLLGAGDEKTGIIVGVDESEYENLFNKAASTPKYNFLARHELDSRGRSKMGPKDNLLQYVCDKLRKDDRQATKDVVATILKGHFTKKAFLENLPPLAKFRTEVIPEAVKKGYMIGLDGRKIWVPNEHLAMGAYLQGFEAVIMKYAFVLTNQVLRRLDTPYGACAHVHDEKQLETPDAYTEKVGEVAAWSIKKAGILLHSRCPLEGEYKIGKSWGETH